MSELGKCLLFYLKFPAEVDRLYVADESNTEGLPNAKRVLEKIKLVGDQANRDVADFGELLAPPIEGHFRTICEITRARTNTSQKWDFRFVVSPRSDLGNRFEVGVYIDHVRAALFPWVSCSGGRRVEDELFRIIGRGIKSAARDGCPGTIGLAEITIPLPERLDEPVACEPLVAQVARCFASITAQHVERIAAIGGPREMA